MSADVDVVVIGGGVGGSSAAWQLSRAGRSVCVVDRFARGHSRGSSHGSSRLFRLPYPHVDWVRHARAALDGWRDLEADAGRRLLTRLGGLDLGDAAALRPVAAALTAAGVPHDRLAADAVARRWPGIRTATTAIHQPDAARIDADGAVAALQELAADRGTDLRHGTRVERIEPHDGGVRVHAGDGTVTARTAVVAAGSWTRDLVPAAVPLPPLAVTEETVLHFPARGGAREAASWPAFMHHGRPFRYGIGVGPEGVKVGEHHSGARTTGDDRTGKPDRAIRDRLRRYVADSVPGLVPEPIAATTCLYTTQPGDAFVVDRAGPIVVVAACSGHGFKFAPLLGALVERLVADPTHQTPFPLPRR